MDIPQNMILYAPGADLVKAEHFSMREYELTKYLDTVILEDIITPEVRVVHCALCNLWRPHMQKVSNSDQARSFYCSTVQFILYMLALCFWTNQLFIAIIRLNCFGDELIQPLVFRGF